MIKYTYRLFNNTIYICIYIYHRRPDPRDDTRQITMGTRNRGPCSIFRSYPPPIKFRFARQPRVFIFQQVCVHKCDRRLGGKVVVSVERDAGSELVCLTHDEEEEKNGLSRGYSIRAAQFSMESSAARAISRRSH